MTYNVLSGTLSLYTTTTTHLCLCTFFYPVRKLLLMSLMVQVHLQKTGHAPAAPSSLVNLPVSAGCASSERPSPATTSASTGSRPAEYSKLVRGQDVWLSGGGERTRRSILRCIQCGESFRSLPELTVHMVHTRHYTNIVGGPPSSSAGHVTSELPVVG